MIFCIHMEKCCTCLSAYIHYKNQMKQTNKRDNNKKKSSHKRPASRLHTTQHYENKLKHHILLLMLYKQQDNEIGQGELIEFKLFSRTFFKFCFFKFFFHLMQRLIFILLSRWLVGCTCNNASR